MNEIQVFNNTEFGEIRTALNNNEPMFCLTDICKALGLTQPSKVKERLNEKGVRSIPTLTNGGEQNLLYINESNLYKTIFQSRKENAEKFTDWVTSEVLPSIRKTGGYRIPHTVGGQIQLLAQGYTELAQEVHEFKEEVNIKIDKLENDIPLYGCEMEEITQHVKRKVVTILGGKDSAAYRNKSIRNSVFADIYRQLKREYGAVSTYKSIKRKYIADAHEFIDCYAVPRVIEDEIEEANSQVKLSV